ncbi:MAG TPA: cysteine rich repeat-containing protein [Polyangia bacterium]|nr:cysteine rich repeat-containing protein [Polyangia bacterium]
MTSSLRALFLGLALATSSVAFADGPPAPPPDDEGAARAKLREACHDDVARLCAGVEPGGGRIRECLRAHVEQLSDGCKLAIRNAQAHHHPRGGKN